MFLESNILFCKICRFEQFMMSIECKFKLKRVIIFFWLTQDSAFLSIALFLGWVVGWDWGVLQVFFMIELNLQFQNETSPF